MKSKEQRIIEFLLCLFFGYLGVHKFYAKNINMGIIYLVTGGLLGVGWFVDTITMLIGLIGKNKTDSQLSISAGVIDSSKYEYIRKLDELHKISYDKQSRIVSIFTRKWYDVCQKDFIVLDFETTGLDKVYDSIIEIAAIRFENGVEKEKYVTLVKPLLHIPLEATAINHITNQMVRNAPSEKDTIPKLIDFIGDSIIVGHNVNFDIGFLEIAAQRQGKNVQYNYIDTMSIAKKLFPDLPDYKLGTIAQFLDFDTSSLHRAEADVYVCSEIVKIALDTLSADFENVSKELKAVKPLHTTSKSIGTSGYNKISATQALARDGKLRKQLGEHLVIVSHHGGSCEKCKKFENKILIDDVYSGGSRKDGNYMLLSEAMAQGLFHEGCRHGLGTYYPELKDITGY